MLIFKILPSLWSFCICKGPTAIPECDGLGRLIPSWFPSFPSSLCAMLLLLTLASCKRLRGPLSSHGAKTQTPPVLESKAKDFAASVCLLAQFGLEHTFLQERSCLAYLLLYCKHVPFCKTNTILPLSLPFLTVEPSLAPGVHLLNCALAIKENDF